MSYGCAADISDEDDRTLITTFSPNKPQLGSTATINRFSHLKHKSIMELSPKPPLGNKQGILHL